MTSLVAALVPAAGRGDRLGGGVPKALREVGGVPLLVHAVRRLRRCVQVVVVAAPANYVDTVRASLDRAELVVPGAETRAASVRVALAALPPAVDVVLVHDAARPFVPVTLIEAVIEAVRAGHDAVVPVLPLTETIKRVGPDGRVAATVDRADLYAAQTPQGFRREVLEAAHASSTGDATDDAVLVEALGRPVWTVPGAEEAFKVTRPVDLELAEMLAHRSR